MGLAMYTRFAGLLAMIPFGILVGAHDMASEPRHQVARRSTTYTRKNIYQGQDFFNDWWFQTGSDPTGGYVNYLSMSDATSQGLAYVNSDNAFVMAVDSKSSVAVGGYRNSVRITSNSQWTGGLFILDAAAMPVGCGTWPGFWTNGPNWPYAGEIDIVEGVDDQSYNQMTLHSGTSNACTLSKTTSNPFTGHILGTNCYSTQSADAGCSIQDTNTTSFGYGFNNASGGVFALLWDPSVGMAIWHFARDNIPAEINNQAQTLTPANWGTPAGSWSAASCNIGVNFYDHSMIFDTTICGGWGGSAYGSSGCSGTCAEAVADPSNFVNAQWVINYVAVFQ